MANNDAPAGLRPTRHLSGGVVRADALFDGILTAYARDIYYGDLVTLASDGTITTANAGDRPYGVFAGCQYVDSDGTIRHRNYWPKSTAATKIIAYVYRDPNIVYEVQCNSNFSSVDVGAHADIVYTSGTSLNGLSRVEIDSGLFAASTQQLNVLGLVQRAANSYGTNAKIEVRLNEHYFGPASNTGV